MTIAPSQLVTRTIGVRALTAATKQQDAEIGVLVVALLGPPLHQMLPVHQVHGIPREEHLRVTRQPGQVLTGAQHAQSVGHAIGDPTQVFRELQLGHRQDTPLDPRQLSDIRQDQALDRTGPGERRTAPTHSVRDVCDGTFEELIQAMVRPLAARTRHHRPPPMDHLTVVVVGPGKHR